MIDTNLEFMYDSFRKMFSGIELVNFDGVKIQNFSVDIKEDLQEIFNPYNRLFGKKLWYIPYIILDLFFQISTAIMKGINYIFLSYPENPGIEAFTSMHQVDLGTFSEKHKYAFLNDLNAATPQRFEEISFLCMHPRVSFDLFFNKFTPNHIVGTLSHFDNGLMIPDRSVDIPENYGARWDYRRVFRLPSFRPRMFWRYNSAMADMHDYAPQAVKEGNFPLAEEQKGFVRYLDSTFDIDLKKWENFNDVQETIDRVWGHKRLKYLRQRPLHDPMLNADNFFSDEEFDTYQKWCWLFGEEYFIPKDDPETIRKPMILSDMSGKDIRDEDVYYKTFEIIHSARYDMILLSDEISGFLQRTFNFTDTASPYQLLWSIRVITILFAKLIGLRFALYWFMSFNPYQNIISTLFIASIDWLENIVGFVPLMTYGIPINLMLMLDLIDKISNMIPNIYLTFPYLPSEAKLEYLHDDRIFNTHKYLFYEMVSPWERMASKRLFFTPDYIYDLYNLEKKFTIPLPRFLYKSVKDGTRFYYSPRNGIHSNTMYPVFKYEGLPKLWLENGIPNNLRTYWFWERPTAFKEFYNQFEEARLKSNLQLLPDYVIKDLKQNVPNLDLSDLSKMKIQDLYEFLFNNLSQPLMSDLMKQLNSEFQVLDIKVTDYLDMDTIFAYRHLLENFNPTDFPLVYSNIINSEYYFSEYPDIFNKVMDSERYGVLLLPHQFAKYLESINLL